jgi:hypothetical protein
MTGKSLRPLLIIIISLLLLTTIVGCITDLDPRSFHSEYRYEVGIKHNGPLSNATFIIPIPVKNNTPMVGEYVLSTSDFSKTNIMTNLTQSPSGFNFNQSKNISGYAPWFLIIKTESPVKDTKYGEVYYIERKMQFKLNTPDFKVNTLTPIGNESLLVPKNNFLWKKPSISEVHSRQIKYLSPSNPQEFWIYADFNAPSTTMVEIYSGVEGHNWWKQEYDAGMMNGYSDRFSKVFYGEAHGWYLVKGDFSAAQGIYPNYDNPDWQKALNQTAEPGMEPRS